MPLEELIPFPARMPLTHLPMAPGACCCSQLRPTFALVAAEAAEERAAGAAAKGVGEVAARPSHARARIAGSVGTDPLDTEERLRAWSAGSARSVLVQWFRPRR